MHNSHFKLPFRPSDINVYETIDFSQDNWFFNPIDNPENSQFTLTENVVTNPSIQNGFANPSTQNVVQLPLTQNVFTNPSTGNVITHPSTGNVFTNPSIENVDEVPSIENVNELPSTQNVVQENRNRRVVCLDPEADYAELGFLADLKPKYNIILWPSTFGVKRKAPDSPYLIAFKKFLEGKYHKNIIQFTSMYLKQIK